MKHPIVFFPLLFACAAAAAPPSASSSGEAPQAAVEAARAGREAARSADEAARAGDRAARAANDAARAADEALRTAELQKRMSELARRMAELSAKIGDQASASALRYLADSKRGMLGLALEDDAAGLRVTAVTPGGPAERAGIRDGDVITAVDGRPAGNGGDSLLAGAVVAGKPVKLSLLRDGKPLQFRVTPERFQAADWQALARTAQTAAQRSLEKLNSPGFRRQLDVQMQDAMKQAERARAQIAAHWVDRLELDGRWFATWWGLNLASLNPELGSYFGTDTGALVLSRDAQHYAGLQAGDVITAVNGAVVARPEEVMRALQSSPAGEPAHLAVLRHGKRLALDLKLPPRRDLLPPEPPDPPEPPAPPSRVAGAVPAPPAPPVPKAPPVPPAPPQHR